MDRCSSKISWHVPLRLVLATLPFHRIISSFSPDVLINQLSIEAMLRTTRDESLVTNRVSRKNIVCTFGLNDDGSDLRQHSGSLAGIAGYGSFGTVFNPDFGLLQVRFRDAIATRECRDSN